MPNLTDQEVHEIALELQAVREELKGLGDADLLEQRLKLEGKLFETECRLGRSLPPVTITLVL